MTEFSNELIGLALVTIAGGTFLWRFQNKMDKDFSEIRKDISNLAQRVARIEGLLSAPPPAPQSGDEVQA